MWTEEVVETVKENYVALSLDGVTAWTRKDAVGEFIRKTECAINGSSGALHAMAADGTKLVHMNTPSVGSPITGFLGNAAKAWAALPAEKREPGAIQIEKTGPLDVAVAPPNPPQGCMIVRVWNRPLAYNGKGNLRYTVPEDYIESVRHDAARYREPGNDFMWIPEEEWRAFVPESPKVGDAYPVPVAFELRLYRFHLDPHRGISQGMAFSRTNADEGKLTLTVETVSPSKLTLRMVGSVALNQPTSREPILYAPAILGYLEYDRDKKQFTRFDMLALGTASGYPHNHVDNFRHGPYPLGIAFELETDPTPGELLRPRGVRWDGDNKSNQLTRYLEPKDKR